MIGELIKLIQTFGDKDELGGLYLGKPTGKVHPEDATYLEVLIHDQSFYVKPCMSFGSFNIPDAAWLNKYKDEVMVWVAFENGNSAHGVYMGVSPKDSTRTFSPTMAQQKEIKFVNFKILLDDSTGSLTITQNDENDEIQRTIKMDAAGTKLSDSNGSYVELNSDGSITLKNKSGYGVAIQDTQVITGNQGSSTAVLAEALDLLLTKLLTTLSATMVIVNGATVPLTTAAQFSAMIGDIKNFYAKSVKVD